MSIQTGQELPVPRTSNRLVDRLGYAIALAIRDPNPIWIRELKQSARLTRTPLILMAFSLLMTLVIVSLGGTMSDREPADKVGITLYHTYFSIAYFVVALVGPALAANAVASEREGRTWDAIVLTGLSPERIARGKFLAAFTAISTYIFMLAPVGALAFLFGGVTATEVAIAFVYLFLVAAVFVSLGLAISAKLSTLRASIVITLLLVVPLAAFVYMAFGLGASDSVHELWPRVPAKFPMWLPTAYLRGEPGVPYALILFVMPFVALTVSMWFCHESTIANLSDENADRGFGLKRWYIVSILLIAGASIFAESLLPQGAAEPAAVISVVILGGFLGFSVVLFTAEPVGPSRRVRAARIRTKQGAFRRFLGPSVVNSAYLELASGVTALVVVGALGASRIDAGPVGHRTSAGFVCLLAYAVAFFAFTVGFSVWLRARASSATMARILLVVSVLGICVFPWVVAAILGVLARDESGLLVASPSPFFAVAMYQAATNMAQQDRVVAGVVCIIGWTLFGSAFLLAGARRGRKIREASERASVEADALLAAEEPSTAVDPDTSASAA